MTALLHERVSRCAESLPAATAVVMGDERLCYGELEQRANRTARLLLESGVRPGDRVCLLQPKSPGAIVSMLATLKAGAIYVPVDVSNPAVRVRRIITAAEPRLLLVTPDAGELLTALGTDVPVGAVSGSLPGALFGAGDEAGLSDEPLAPATRAEDPTSLLFTSGSTGTPKGVVITHAMVGAFLDWALAYFGHQPGERTSGHPPLHFDLSTFDIYGTLSAGGELHLVPPNVLLPGQLAAFIRDSELTQWFSVPSTFAYMARFGVIREGDFPQLRRIIWCGEVLPTPVLAHWMERVPQASYTNLYGPTETTIASSWYALPGPPEDTTTPIPIGLPCAGEDILVLDEELRAVAPGEVGELCIAGAGLSPGYWRDEERTRAAFVLHPSTGQRLYRTGDLGRRDREGLLHFLGRKDSQIKSRGYRIELGEIEATLTAVAGVAECAVVGAPSDGFEGTAICCAWAPLPGVELDPLQLRQALAEALPSYMLPTRWQALDELPKNVNGKIDRLRLREMFSGQAAGG
ncbi:MAG: amino acid adenylation domain-containing protein [Solirubrobacteraceae bacterium]